MAQPALPPQGDRPAPRRRDRDFETLDERDLTADRRPGRGGGMRDEEEGQEEDEAGKLALLREAQAIQDEVRGQVKPAAMGSLLARSGRRPVVWRCRRQRYWGSVRDRLCRRPARGGTAGRRGPAPKAGGRARGEPDDHATLSDPRPEGHADHVDPTQRARRRTSRPRIACGAAPRVKRDRISCRRNSRSGSPKSLVVRAFPSS